MLRMRRTRHTDLRSISWARADRLVLATVKSFSGSRGVVAEHVMGRGSTPAQQRLYALLNNIGVHDAVLTAAAHRYGYRHDQVELRLSVGNFAAPTTRKHEDPIRDWCAAQNVGIGPVRVVGLTKVATIAGRSRSVKRIGTMRL